MLENCQSAKELWGGVDTLVSRWLAERQDLIVKYCAISGVQGFSEQAPSTMQRLRACCQVLVDYLSAGHFEVFVQLMREAEEFNDGSIDEARRLYAKIDATTDPILDFNDVYDTEEHAEEAIERLPQELNKLGELIVLRFNLEDQLIKVAHSVHQEMVA